ncbi:MAG TPA: hypothetical protein DHW34_01530 [Actinobacteria bacterium]|nr:hypothetical protein [Actinomycetota bacterium]
MSMGTHIGEDAIQAPESLNCQLGISDQAIKAMKLNFKLRIDDILEQEGEVLVCEVNPIALWEKRISLISMNANTHRFDLTVKPS